MPNDDFESDDNIQDPDYVSPEEEERASDFIIEEPAEAETKDPEPKEELEPLDEAKDNFEEETKPSSPENESLSKKEEIIANEEQEIKKIIEEGEKAAREAAPVPPKYEGPPIIDNGNKESGTWKWFFAGVGIIIIVGVLFFGYQYISTPRIDDIQNTGPLAKFEPSGFLQGWKLDTAYLTLSDIPTDVKKSLLQEGNLTDAATWQLSKGDDTVYVWVKQFESSDAAKSAASSFMPINWKLNYYTRLSFGDESATGIYNTKGQNPLAAFVRQDDMLVSVAYYNTENTQYNPVKLTQDEGFLSGLAKSIMTQIVSDKGDTLHIANITVGF